MGVPEPDIERVVPMRRQLLPPSAAQVVPVPAGDEPELAPVHVSGLELRTGSASRPGSRSF